MAMTQSKSSMSSSEQPEPRWLEAAIAEAWAEAHRQSKSAKLQPTRRELHARQLEFRNSKAKRKVIRAGRRGGKTVGVADIAIEALGHGRRVLYATPTAEQLDSFWWEVTNALRHDVEIGNLYKNETEHVLELPGTKCRIRAKTAWNADTLRGDYADLLILDEWQLMNEDAWDRVGAPMLLDNDGDAIFVYTPPTAKSRSVSKAIDKLHAAKLFKRAKADTTGRWAVFHFTSRDNPHISAAAIDNLAQDMTALAIRQEIYAEDVEEVPGAIWKQKKIDELRVSNAPKLKRVVVAVDPSATKTGNEAGVIAAGLGFDNHGYVLDDRSLQGSPQEWAGQAVEGYHLHDADIIVAEDNNGGEMVEITIGTIKGAPPVKRIHATRGKATRAEPVSILYDHNRAHHVGVFAVLESEMTTWVPGDESPNRMDALVWALTELMISAAGDMPKEQPKQPSRWTDEEFLERNWKKY